MQDFRIRMEGLKWAIQPFWRNLLPKYYVASKNVTMGQLRALQSIMVWPASELCEFPGRVFNFGMTNWIGGGAYLNK
jgi:hypothetical protein